MTVQQCLYLSCGRPAVADWWLLCEHHTLLLEASSDVLPSALGDQASAAGWDATTWAERIAPDRWGHAVEDEPWVMRLRALSLAAAVSRRALPCGHASGSDAALALVVVARDPLRIACPTCAEATVARATTDGHACDRCRAVAVRQGDRTALLVGRSLILVGQLCDDCAEQSLQTFRLHLDG